MSPLDLWETDFTEEIRDIAKTRVLDGGNLAARMDLSRRTVKLALILVRILNPAEEFSNAEIAVLMGVGKNRVSEILADKHFLQVVNR